MENSLKKFNACARPGLGKHFSTEGHAENFIATGGAYITYITSMNALKTLTKTFCIS